MSTPPDQIILGTSLSTLPFCVASRQLGGAGRGSSRKACQEKCLRLGAKGHSGLRSTEAGLMQDGVWKAKGTNGVTSKVAVIAMI